MKTLLIEDDKVWRTVTHEILERKGFQVVMMSEILDDLNATHEYPLIICDNKISGKKVGFEFLRRVRTSGHNGHLVLYTSFPNRSVFEEGLKFDIQLVSKRRKLSVRLEEIISSQCGSE